MARNFIDRCFEAVAPVHAVRRSAARTALQFLNSGYGNYGANLTKKSMRGWEYHGGSSKEDIEDNIDVLRQRSRDAYMGVPVAASARENVAHERGGGRPDACAADRRRIFGPVGGADGGAAGEDHTGVLLVGGHTGVRHGRAGQFLQAQQLAYLGYR